MHATETVIMYAQVLATHALHSAMQTSKERVKVAVGRRNEHPKRGKPNVSRFLEIKDI